MLTSALAGPMQMDFIVRLRWIRLRHTFGSIGQSPDDRFSPRRCSQVNRWDFICITCARINSLKIYVNCSHVRLIFKPHLHLHPAIDRSLYFYLSNSNRCFFSCLHYLFWFVDVITFVNGPCVQICWAESARNTWHSSASSCELRECLLSTI